MSMCKKDNCTVYLTYENKNIYFHSTWSFCFQNNIQNETKFRNTEIFSKLNKIWEQFVQNEIQINSLNFGSFCLFVC